MAGRKWYGLEWTHWLLVTTLWPMGSLMADELTDLQTALNQQPPGVAVRMGGIDMIQVLKTITDELVKNRQQRICYQFNLTISEKIDAETATALRKTIEETIPLIEEACAKVK